MGHVHSVTETFRGLKSREPGPHRGHCNIIAIYTLKKKKYRTKTGAYVNVLIRMLYLFHILLAILFQYEKVGNTCLMFLKPPFFSKKESRIGRKRCTL